MATGCYVPRYLPASYKGVPFEALEVTSEHGRRGAEGEFPFGETTAYADLGRAIRRYTISGRLAENNHILGAAAIIAAVETPGPGILVHPTRGLVTVACTRLGVRDNVDEEQGVTYLEFDFVEGNDWTSGFNLGGLLGGIDLANIIAASVEHFTDNYHPQTDRWYQAQDVIRTASAAMQVIATQYTKAVGLEQSQKEWRISTDFATVINDPYVLRVPEQFATAATNGLALLDNRLTGTPKVTSFKWLANWAVKTSTLSAEAAQSEEAIYTLLRVLSAAYMTRGVTEAGTTTLDAALSEYDTIMTILTEEAQIAQSGCFDMNYYLSIRDFIVLAQKTLLDRAYNLPALVTYQFPGVVHSLVAAHEVYGDAKRSREIETRNPQYLPWAMGQSIVASGSGT